jgi:hypothetical protein
LFLWPTRCAVTHSAAATQTPSILANRPPKTIIFVEYLVSAARGFTITAVSAFRRPDTATGSILKPLQRGLPMADEDAKAKAEELQKELGEHNKKIETCNNQIDKLDAIFKKAMQAVKKLDEVRK